MKISPRVLLLGLVILAAALTTTPLRAVGDDDPILQGPTHTPRLKVVTLDCNHDWRASAVGQYGGVGFALSCFNGRSRQRLDGVSGTLYSVRIGAENDEVGLDCFFNGDSAVVNEMCASAAHFTVR